METNELDFYIGSLVELESDSTLVSISPCEWGCTADDV